MLTSLYATVDQASPQDEYVMIHQLSGAITHRTDVETLGVRGVAYYAMMRFQMRPYIRYMKGKSGENTRE